MDSLTSPFDPAGGARQPLLPFPPGIFVPFALLLAGAWGLGWIGALSAAGVRGIGVVGFHGALLAATLAAGWRGSSGWKAAAVGSTGLLALAAALSRLSAWGAASYLLVPLAIGVLSMRRRELDAVGLRLRWDPGGLALGLAVGLFLGAHLLVSASRTFGYQIRPAPLGEVLAALAYDVGANVFAAECFFRGALFGYWQRRWGFWEAAGAATGLSVIRYLIDPALPGTLAVMVGAFFYLSFLGLSGCALLRWRGSLLPSVLASLMFFAAYRVLAGGDS